MKKNLTLLGKTFLISQVTPIILFLIGFLSGDLEVGLMLMIIGEVFAFGSYPFIFGHLKRKSTQSLNIDELNMSQKTNKSKSVLYIFLLMLIGLLLIISLALITMVIMANIFGKYAFEGPGLGILTGLSAIIYSIPSFFIANRMVKKIFK